jgi:tetratricopeptide (TPR) repeat protein
MSGLRAAFSVFLCFTLIFAQVAPVALAESYQTEQAQTAASITTLNQALDVICKAILGLKALGNIIKALEDLLKGLKDFQLALKIYFDPSSLFDLSACLPNINVGLFAGCFANLNFDLQAQMNGAAQCLANAAANISNIDPKKFVDCVLNGIGNFGVVLDPGALLGLLANLINALKALINLLQSDLGQINAAADVFIGICNGQYGLKGSGLKIYKPKKYKKKTCNWCDNHC